MLKLLIADDEENVRDGLKDAVDWDSLGFEICGEATNGIEALEKVELLKPELIITDIRMPGMDGLQMIREFKERGHACRIIILTGYSEFQYAKQSIALGVESYLLKPIDEDELTLQVTQIRESIEQERKLEGYFNDSMAAATDNIILSLVSGQFGSGVIEKANQIYRLKLPWKSYQVMLVDSTEGTALERSLKSRLKNELAEFAAGNNYGYVFDMDGIPGILLKDVSFDENVKPLEYLRKLLEERLGADFVIAVGSLTGQTDEISLSYERAFNLIKNKFIWGSRKIVGYKRDIMAGLDFKAKNANLDDIAGRLYMAVDINNKDSIGKLLTELSNAFLAKNYDEAAIKSNFISIYFEIINKLIVNYESLKSLRLNNEISSRKNIDDLKQYMHGRLSALSDELARNTPDIPMKKIMDYINRNYCEDIKIESLAQIFGYNSIYLGQLFKNHTGMYFNNYLEQVRIENAKLLLKSGLKVYQVAERIGYHSLDYFSGKFKKYTGVSPSEYKGEK